MKKRVLLIILDGFGHNRSRKGNATYNQTPFLRHLLKNVPNTLLKASGRAVGLPRGYMGNSEVGHLNLGAGRDLKEVITKINESIRNKTLFKNKALLTAIKKVKKHNSALHLIGLYSEAGVHSHLNHLKALLKLAQQQKVTKIYLHVIADGRDTKPKELKKYLGKVQRWLSSDYQERFQFATLSGRYYAMDRDNNWQRTEKYYKTITAAKGRRAENINQAINKAYQKRETDEFITPTIIKNYKGIKAEDQLIFFNFREDRMRQLAAALGKKSFNKFAHKNHYNITCMYPYDDKFNFPTIIKKEIFKNTLSEVLSKNKKQQLKIAETEKYAHLTYFFNGGKEKKYSQEKRTIIPSSKVATYDKQPQMSAPAITKKTLSSLGRYDFIAVNFANPDMVAHTGNKIATKVALNIVDLFLEQIVLHAIKKNYTTIITADHGNCEKMNGKWQKSHTTSKVPFLLIGKYAKLKTGSLKNIAPTILELMRIKIPKEMTAKSLIK